MLYCSHLSSIENLPVSLTHLRFESLVEQKVYLKQQHMIDLRHLTQLQKLDIRNLAPLSALRICLPASLVSFFSSNNFDGECSFFASLSNLSTLVFGSSFNQILTRSSLPSSLKKLKMGYMYQQDMSQVHLPHLRDLRFHGPFAHPNFPVAPMLKRLKIFGAISSESLLEQFPKLTHISCFSWYSTSTKTQEKYNQLYITYLLAKNIDKMKKRKCQSAA
jgi:hypothetical protein